MRVRWSLYFQPLLQPFNALMIGRVNVLFYFKIALLFVILYVVSHFGVASIGYKKQDIQPENK